MNYNNLNTPECVAHSNPALTEIYSRLQKQIERFGDLTCELNTKLQMIQRYEEPSQLNDNLKEKEPNCLVDDMFGLISRLTVYNNSIEASIRHLNQIV